jgi:hypothetical protein
MLGSVNEKSKDWAGTIELEKIGWEWKILTMKDLILKGDR